MTLQQMGLEFPKRLIMGTLVTGKQLWDGVKDVFQRRCTSCWYRFVSICREGRAEKVDMQTTCLTMQSLCSADFGQCVLGLPLASTIF